MLELYKHLAHAYAPKELLGQLDKLEAVRNEESKLRKQANRLRRDCNSVARQLMAKAPFRDQRPDSR